MGLLICGRCGASHEHSEQFEREMIQCDQKIRDQERDRILAIIDEEASHYSYKEEMIRPSIVAAVFVNSVRAKVEQSPKHLPSIR